MSKCIIFPVGPFTPYLWGMVKPFLDPRTAEKVVLLTGGSQPPDLSKYIPETSTPLRWLPDAIKDQYSEPSILPPFDVEVDEDFIHSPVITHDGGGGGGGRSVDRSAASNHRRHIRSTSRGKGSHFRCSCLKCSDDNVKHRGHQTSSERSVETKSVLVF